MLNNKRIKNFACVISAVQLKRIDHKNNYSTKITTPGISGNMDILSGMLPTYMCMLFPCTVGVNKMLTQSPVWYCCGTVSVLLRYGRGTVRFGSVRFKTAIYYTHTLTCEG